MVATLARGANGTFTVGNQRSFDCWGNVRLGAASGDPSGRYCGNLGHKQDDESGLIYMRARYYEPASGRFISEDPKQDGANLYVCCKGRPTDQVDQSGKLAGPEAICLGMLLAYYTSVSVFWEPDSPDAKTAKLIIDSTLGALGDIDMIKLLALSSDPREMATGGEVGMFVALTALAVVLVCTAAYQLSLLAFVATEGDYYGNDDLNANLGNPWGAVGMRGLLK